MARKKVAVVEDPKRRLLGVCRHSGPACWPCVAQDMERQRDEAEAALHEVAGDLRMLAETIDTGPEVDVESLVMRLRDIADDAEGAAPRPATAALAHARGEES